MVGTLRFAHPTRKLLGRRQIIVRQLHGRALGITRTAEQPAVEPEEWLRGGKKAIAKTVAHHDPGRL